MSNENSNSLGDNCGSADKKVAIYSIEVCKAMDPLEWPPGDFLKKNISDSEHFSGSFSASKFPHGYASTEGMNFNFDSKYWQAAARLALIKKYGYSIPSLESSSLQFNEIHLVHERWEELVNEIVCRKPSVNASEGVTNSSESDDLKLNKYVTTLRDQIEGDEFIGEREGSVLSTKMDIIDFINNQCCMSNSRQMEWSLMSCPPGVQFQLHAHPNIELIYCIRGALHEVRMNGPPISRHFEKQRADGGDETLTKVVGPNLTYIQRSWAFDTLKASQWLVNEVGSIHKSFTSSKSDGGCDLLVLWGGSHANILDAPITPNVQHAVDLMDEQLNGDYSRTRSNNNAFCCSETNDGTISATFLPESEKSGLL